MDSVWMHRPNSACLCRWAEFMSSHMKRLEVNDYRLYLTFLLGKRLNFPNTVFVHAMGLIRRLEGPLCIDQEVFLLTLIWICLKFRFDNVLPFTKIFKGKEHVFGHIVTAEHVLLESLDYRVWVRDEEMASMMTWLYED